MGDKEDKLKNKVIQLFGDNAKPKRPQKTLSVKQTATGNNNLQVVADNVTLDVGSKKKVVISHAYPVGSIGANATLKERIESMMNTLGLRRENRFGKDKSPYAIIRRNLKNEFGIPTSAQWTVIWSWPESRAAELIAYFESKLANTVEGRIGRASQKAGYKLTRGRLFEREKEYCDMLGCTPASPEVKELRRQMFGSASRKDLNDMQFRSWVEKLKELVERVHGTDF